MGFIKNTYNREQLYLEVWKESVVTVSKKYGISDVGLKKVCKRLHIPTPWPGYWAQIKAGQKIDIPILPKYNGPNDIELTHFKIAIEDSKPKEDKPEIPKSPIFEKVEKAYNLIAETNEILYLQKELRSIFFSVSESCVERALGAAAIMVKTLKNLGYKVEKESSGERILVDIDGEKMNIRIREKQKRIEHILTPEEELKKKTGKYYYASKYDYIPTGKLSLITDEWWCKNREWTDKKNKKIEDQIIDFIVELIITSIYIKERREKERLEELHCREEEEKRWELEMLQKKEMENFKVLKNIAMDWHNAHIIDSFLCVFEQHLNNSNFEDKEQLLRWLSWAKNKVQWLNPLIAKDDPILGLRHSIPTIED